MNLKELKQLNIEYVVKKNRGEHEFQLWKIAVVDDKMLEGYTYDHTEGKNNNIAVFVKETV
jgi:hypothetical protein